MRRHPFHRSRVLVFAAALGLVPCAAPAEEHNVPPEGFRALFSGKDLSGWQGLIAGGNPEKVHALDRAQRAEAQRVADIDMRKYWRVEGGEIINDEGKGTYLTTVEEFGDFELLLDWRIAPGADSGIYLRGVPQVQIWDPVAGIDAAKVGSGGLYNNQKHPSLPLAVADRPAGEWNTFRILMVGDVVTVRLNDQLVVAETPLENYWNRKRPVYPTGPIQLQTHGGELRFRNVFIREIESRPPESGHLAKGKPAGDGWRSLEAPEPGATGIHAWTAAELGDFELHALVKLTGGGTAGLRLRVPPEGGSAASGYELGIGEGRWGSLLDLGGDGVLGARPAAASAARPGDWNHYYAIARDDTLRVWLNGVSVAEAVHPRGARRGVLALRLPEAGSAGSLEVGGVHVRAVGETFHLEYEAPPDEAEFVALFSGKDLEGWIGRVEGYAAEEGKLICLKKGGGNLYTARKYKDFVLRFDFKLEPGANNGVGIRATYDPSRPDHFPDAAYHGMEIQILENTHPDYANLHPYQYHGSIYDLVPALRGYQKPVGYWNSEEIAVRGNRVTVTLNGKVIADADMREVAEQVPPGKVERHPGLFNEDGYVGFLGHGHRIEFRNIRLRELE